MSVFFIFSLVVAVGDERDSRGVRIRVEATQGGQIEHVVHGHLGRGIVGIPGRTDGNICFEIVLSLCEGVLAGRFACPRS